MTTLGVIFLSLFGVILVMGVIIMGLSEEVASLKQELEDYK